MNIKQKIYQIISIFIFLLLPYILLIANHIVNSYDYTYLYNILISNIAINIFIFCILSLLSLRYLAIFIISILNLLLYLFINLYGTMITSIDIEVVLSSNYTEAIEFVFDQMKIDISLLVYMFFMILLSITIGRYKSINKKVIAIIMLISSISIYINKDINIFNIIYNGYIEYRDTSSENIKKITLDDTIVMNNIDNDKKETHIIIGEAKSTTT